MRLGVAREEGWYPVPAQRLGGPCCCFGAPKVPLPIKYEHEGRGETQARAPDPAAICPCTWEEAFLNHRFGVWLLTFPLFFRTEVF